MRPLPLALAALVVAGALLRFPSLGEDSLWHDELASWVAATRPATIGGVLAVAGGEDMHPPGYYLLLRLLTRLFGDAETSLRLPSAIAGTLAVVALFALGRRLYGGREAILAAGLCAVLPFPVLYSREARAYSLVLLGAAVTALLLVRAHARIEESLATAASAGAEPGARRGGERSDRAGEPPWPELLGFAAVGTLLAYLHYFGMLLVGLESVAALLLVRRCRRRRVVAALLVIAPVVLAAAWLPWMSLAMVRRRYWPQPVSWKTPLRFLDAFLYASKPASAIVLLGMAAAAALSTLRWRRRERARRAAGGSPPITFATAACVLWIALPSAILLIFSWLGPFSITIDRAMIIVLPPLYLLVARSVTTLSTRTAGQVVIAAVLLAAAGARWSSTDGYRELDFRQDYRSATRAFASALAAAPPDPLAVALVVAPARTPLLAYYLEREPAAPAIDVEVSGDEGLRALAAALDGGAPSEVILFCQLPRLLHLTAGLVEGRYELAERQSFGARLEVRRYVRRGEHAPVAG